MLFKMEYIRCKIKRNKNKTFQQNTKHKLTLLGQIIRQEGIQGETLEGRRWGERGRERPRATRQTTSRRGWEIGRFDKNGIRQTLVAINDS